MDPDPEHFLLSVLGLRVVYMHVYIVCVHLHSVICVACAPPTWCAEPVRSVRGQMQLGLCGLNCAPLCSTDWCGVSDPRPASVHHTHKYRLKHRQIQFETDKYMCNVQSPKCWCSVSNPMQVIHTKMQHQTKGTPFLTTDWYSVSDYKSSSRYTTNTDTKIHNTLHDLRSAYERPPTLIFQNVNSMCGCVRWNLW